MAYVIYENYGLWECAAIDERRERIKLAFFRIPKESHDWLWKV